VVISNGLKKDFEGYYKGSILLAPDGVDVGEFDIKITKDEARRKLNLPFDKKIAIYTGHFYSWKGTDILSAILNYLNDNTIVVTVGGTKKDVDMFKNKISSNSVGKIKLIDHISHELIPYYLKATDCAILIGKKSESISERYTSPLKMFEYMASGCPIVAQDLPSFKEILNSENSLLVEAENAKALAEGINKIFNDNALAQKISSRALKDVQNYTWQKRAGKITDMIA
jgi:glycosyltransferase involved in cell wall biosynthesis